MAYNSPRYIAHKLLIKQKSNSFNDYADLRHIIESNQFSIIEYKKHANSEAVSELIKRLRLENELAQNDSFLYINRNLKFVFINEDISVEDKCALLRHELGHIYDPGLTNSEITYSKIQKEEFANEFSFYVKNPGICLKLKVLMMKKWRLLVAILSLIVCVSGLFFIITSPLPKPIKSITTDVPVQENYNKTFYVTSSGKKYHRKSCVIVKYKNNLTEIKLNDAVKDGYKPCMVCHPQ